MLSPSPNTLQMLRPPRQSRILNTLLVTFLWLEYSIPHWLVFYHAELLNLKICFLWKFDHYWPTHRTKNTQYSIFIFIYWLIYLFILPCHVYGQWVQTPPSPPPPPKENNTSLFPKRKGKAWTSTVSLSICYLCEPKRRWNSPVDRPLFWRKA